MISRIVLILTLVLGLSSGFSPLARQACAEPSIDPKADKILRKMSIYLNALEQFTIHLENSLDTLMENGQKIQRGRSIDVSIKRPNRLRADIIGDVLNQQLFYDGKNVTLYGKNVNYFATTKAPDTLESAMDYAEKSFGLVFPAADLIYKNAYGIMIADIQSGGYVGQSSVFGIECNHLAFQGSETDWQIWVENSVTPFPRKLVITSKWITGAPQFTVFLTEWNASASLQNDLFTFTKPSEAEEIQFLPIEN